MAAKKSSKGGNWVTINGVHVLIENGKITKGPAKFIGSSLSDLPSSGKNAHPRIGKHNLDSDTVRPREMVRGYTESNKIGAVIASKRTGGAISPKEMYPLVGQKKDLTYKKEKAQDDYRLALQSNNNRTASGAKRRYDNASDKLQNLKNSVKDKVSGTSNKTIDGAYNNSDKISLNEANPVKPPIGKNSARKELTGSETMRTPFGTRSPGSLARGKSPTKEGRVNSLTKELFPKAKEAPRTEQGKQGAAKQIAEAYKEGKITADEARSVASKVIGSGSDGYLATALTKLSESSKASNSATKSGSTKTSKSAKDVELGYNTDFSKLTEKEITKGMKQLEKQYGDDPYTNYAIDDILFNASNALASGNFKKASKSTPSSPKTSGSPAKEKTIVSMSHGNRGSSYTVQYSDGTKGRITQAEAKKLSQQWSQNNAENTTSKVSSTSSSVSSTASKVSSATPSAQTAFDNAVQTSTMGDYYRQIASSQEKAAKARAQRGTSPRRRGK